MSNKDEAATLDRSINLIKCPVRGQKKSERYGGAVKVRSDLKQPTGMT